MKKENPAADGRSGRGGRELQIGLGEDRNRFTNTYIMHLIPLALVFVYLYR